MPAHANKLHVDTFTLGPFETNCYVVYPGLPTAGGTGVPPVSSPKPCWIIDASFDPGELIDHIRSKRLNPEALILTHAHVDHIAGAHEVRAAFPNIPILIHEAEQDWLTSAQKNLSAFTGEPVTAPPATRLLKHADQLKLADFTFEVRHTPGHSPGGITLSCAQANLALVGDTLFAGSIGRTDFPNCSFQQLEHSIRTHLYTLPPHTRVLPGHGPETTIERERRGNPFVSG